MKFLVMDPGYSPANRQVIEENARRPEILIEILNQISLNPSIILKSPHVTCAQECAADICTVMHRRWAATRLHWDIIMMM